MAHLALNARKVFKPYLTRKQRFSIMCAHRRAGKTVGCVQDLLTKALALDMAKGRDAPGKYAYVGPYLGQAKEVAWEYLKRLGDPVIIDKNEGELWVQLVTGSKIRIHGADNPDRLRGGYLDGVILDEYADMRPSIYPQVIRPMLADYQGWATFIGTPKGRNEFHKRWVDGLADDRWFTGMYKASETGLLLPEELADARKDMTPEEYEQEFECSFDAAIRGAYYGADIAELERAGRVLKVEYDPDYPVYSAWDLGQSANGMMAIWVFQVILGEIRVLNFYASHGEKLGHYVDWLNARYPNDRTDWLPHDAAVHELGTMKTRIETLVELGCKVARVPRLSIVDGINAVRKELGRTWFNGSTCSEGIEALRQYRTAYDEKRKAFGDAPNRDWTTDIADAFRYLAIAARELAPIKIDKPLPIGIPLPELSFDDFMDIEDRHVEDGRV